jgi:hypothetical protein
MDHSRTQLIGNGKLSAKRLRLSLPGPASETTSNGRTLSKTRPLYL